MPLADFFLSSECLIDAPYQMPGETVEEKGEKWVSCQTKRSLINMIPLIIIVIIIIILLLFLWEPEKQWYKYAVIVGLLGFTVLGFGTGMIIPRIESREMVAKYNARAAQDPTYSWNTFINELQREKDLEMQERQASALEMAGYADVSREVRGYTKHLEPIAKFFGKK